MEEAGGGGADKGGFQEPKLCLLERTEAKGPGVQALEGPEGLLQAEDDLMRAAPQG